MSRWKAAAIHLAISGSIGVVVAALLLLVWYPPPYFHAAGADELVLLLVGVDLVVGPLLTLILFRLGKPGLAFDLTVIALLQIGALVYGLSVVLRSRPVFLVGAVDRIALVSASDIAPTDLAQGSTPAYRSLSWNGPRLVGARMPDEPDARNELLFSAIEGRDIEVLPRYYVPYETIAAGLLARAKPVDAIRDAATRDAVERALGSIHATRAGVVWLPLVARKQDMLMLLDSRSGRPLRAVAGDPWGS